MMLRCGAPPCLLIVLLLASALSSQTRSLQQTTNPSQSPRPQLTPSGSSATSSSVQTFNCGMNTGEGFVGTVVETQETPSTGRCCLMCRDNQGCHAWVHDRDAGVCTLIADPTGLEECDGFCVSGLIEDRTSFDPKIQDADVTVPAAPSTVPPPPTTQPPTASQTDVSVEEPVEAPREGFALPPADPPQAAEVVSPPSDPPAVPPAIASPPDVPTEEPVEAPTAGAVLGSADQPLAVEVVPPPSDTLGGEVVLVPADPPVPEVEALTPGTGEVRTRADVIANSAVSPSPEASVVVDGDPVELIPASPPAEDGSPADPVASTDDILEALGADAATDCRIEGVTISEDVSASACTRLADMCGDPSTEIGNVPIPGDLEESLESLAEACSSLKATNCVNSAIKFASESCNALVLNGPAVASAQCPDQPFTVEFFTRTTTEACRGISGL